MERSTQWRLNRGGSGLGSDRMGAEGALTPIAAAITRDLRDHPEGRTLDDLVHGTQGDRDGVREGLAELDAHGRARHDGAGRWRLS